MIVLLWFRVGELREVGCHPPHEIQAAEKDKKQHGEDALMPGVAHIPQNGDENADERPYPQDDVGHGPPSQRIGAGQSSGNSRRKVVRYMGNKKLHPFAVGHDRRPWVLYERTQDSVSSIPIPVLEAEAAYSGQRQPQEEDQHYGAIEGPPSPAALHVPLGVISVSVGLQRLPEAKRKQSGRDNGVRRLKPTAKEDEARQGNVEHGDRREHLLARAYRTQGPRHYACP